MTTSGTVDPPRVLFVHIPKTAGMSLYAALERWATPGRSLRYPNDGGDYPAYRALAPARLAELRLLSGHLTYPAFGVRDLTGWSPITIIREPVRRTLSVYSFVISNRNHPWHDMVKRWSLDEFLDWLAKHPANIDQQCLFIAEVRDAEHAFEMLQSKFALAAPLEYLPRFVDILSGQLGTRLRIGRQNRSGAEIDPETLPPTTLDRIRALNVQDERLYRLVRDSGCVGRWS